MMRMKTFAEGRRGRTTLLIATLAGSTAAAAPQASVGTAVYWMTADTTSGMMAGATSGGNGASMLRALAGGSPAREDFAHILQLQLGTGRRAQGEPSAEHLPPAALQAGPSLPLVTPQGVPPSGQATSFVPGMERPKGRMLIYWGCGDHARPGQPLVIDFATMAAGKAPAIYSSLNLRPENLPAPGRNATYGEWPNQRSSTRIPAGGSLVGEHVVRGNYTPEMRFTVAQAQDFLAPVILTASEASASGAVPLAWRQVGGAKAWFASTMGSAGNGDLVMWSSSETQVMPMLMAHLAPADIARLVQQKMLMPASATGCTVPSEAAKAAPQSMLSITAFGGESDFSYPARPAKAAASWKPDWAVKLRTQSTYAGLLGMDMGAMMSRSESSEPSQPAQKKKKKDILREGLGKLFSQ